MIDAEFSACELPVTEGLIVAKADEIWQHASAVFDLTPVKTDHEARHYSVRTWATKLCVFSQNHFGPNVRQRTKKHIRDSGNLVLIHRYLSGGAQGRTEDTPFAMMPGRITIRDFGATFEAVQSPAVFQGVLVPHAVLDFDPGTHPQQLIFDADSTFAQIIHAQLDQFFAGFREGQETIKFERLQRFLSCLRVAINQGNVERDIRAQARQALAEVIKQFIEHHLASPDLSSALLLRKFGVSRATLFRIFAPYGGVRTYISSRRMARAIFQIAQAPMTRGQISRASSDWGFSSDANFNRAVHRHFGAPPSALFWQPLTKLSQAYNRRSMLHGLLDDLPQ
ncbi:MAG: AraC family transcriptional regulator [Pseudomonadota bacterium]